MKLHHYTFNSVGEFGDEILRIAAEPRVSRHASSIGDSFGDTPHTLDAAIDTACEGGTWAKGAKQLEAVQVEVDSDKDLNRRQIVRDVTGFMPNVPALLAGHPQSMYNQKPAPVQNHSKHTQHLSLIHI